MHLVRSLVFLVDSLERCDKAHQVDPLSLPRWLELGGKADTHGHDESSVFLLDLHTNVTANEVKSFNAYAERCKDQAQDHGHQP